MVASPLLKQRYRILSQVGGGGFASVYKAEDIQLGNRLVAIKKMDQSNPSPQDIADFKREALTLASLKQHPNLPNVYEHFEEAGSWYIVMSFIEGETVEDYLYKTIGKPLPPEEVINIGIQLSTVMEFLHDQHPPIVFRDLKPSNVMRTSKGHLYLIDFGIARHFDPLRNNTAALGTLGYAAPEQTGKNPRATPQSDIYTLGATLHELLSGDDPSNNPFTFAPLSLPHQFHALETLIMQMVSINANQRPASMADVTQKLNDIVAQLQPIAGQPVHPPAPVQPGMQVCIVCGTQNPIGTAFCDNCGASMLPPVAPKPVPPPAAQPPPQQQQIQVHQPNQNAQPLPVSTRTPVLSLKRVGKFLGGFTFGAFLYGLWVFGGGYTIIEIFDAFGLHLENFAIGLLPVWIWIALLVTCYGGISGGIALMDEI